MICIDIYRNKDGLIKQFVVNGHADYDERGKDIVCAAISAIVQTAVLGLLQVSNIDIEYEIDQGYVYLSLPENLSHNQIKDADIILETMLTGIKNVEAQYSSFICVKDMEV
ncbi:MAG: ribosomal-processing cysteine protease Prp [Clostridiales bacterium]|nr:ribosomal-processing cysteine protease Prp [Clostridiales bacterium]